MTPKVTHHGEQFDLTFHQYADSGRIAINLVDAEGPYGRATVNIPEAVLAPDEVLIKDWSENHGMLQALVDAGVVEDTGRRVPAGHCEACVCRLLIKPEEVK